MAPSNPPYWAKIPPKFKLYHILDPFLRGNLISCHQKPTFTLNSQQVLPSAPIYKNAYSYTDFSSYWTKILPSCYLHKIYTFTKAQFKFCPLRIWEIHWILTPPWFWDSFLSFNNPIDNESYHILIPYTKDYVKAHYMHSFS